MNVSSGITAATSPEDFVNNYLSKVLKFTKVCGYSNHSDCGFSSKIKDVTKTEMNLPTMATGLAQNLTGGEGTWNNANQNGYSFVSLNGYSMMLFYNQNCLEDVTNSEHIAQDRICLNVIWDINGDKKPNQVGKDIGFTTVLYPIGSVAATPVVAPTNASNGNFSQVGDRCRAYGSDYRAPNRDELASMYFNGKLIGITSGAYWSASSAGSGLGWDQSFNTGHRGRFGVSYGNYVRCLKK